MEDMGMLGGVWYVLCTVSQTLVMEYQHPSSEHTWNCVDTWASKSLILQQAILSGVFM